MVYTGSSLSLGSTILTAFDQLRDSHRHPEREADDIHQERQVTPRRCPMSYRRAISQLCSSDDVQTSTMLSLTVSSQPTPPTNFAADDCQRNLTADTSSSVSSSSSSSSQFQHHLDVLQSPSSVSTTAMAVGCSDLLVTSSVDADFRLRRDSSDDCRSATPSPTVTFCAISSSGVGGGRCLIQPGATGSSYKSRVVAEIVDTERKYVRDLRQIVDVSEFLAYF